MTVVNRVAQEYLIAKVTLSWYLGENVGGRGNSQVQRPQGWAAHICSKSCQATKRLKQNEQEGKKYRIRLERPQGPISLLEGHEPL